MRVGLRAEYALRLDEGAVFVADVVDRRQEAVHVVEELVHLEDVLGLETVTGLELRAVPEFQ